MSHAITIDGPYVVEADQSLVLKSANGFIFAPHTPASLINFGKIIIEPDGDAIGFYAGGDSSDPKAILWNRKSGEIEVRSGAGDAYGVEVDASGPRFRNDGAFATRALFGSAFGFTAQVKTHFINNGDFVTASGGFSRGVLMAGGGEVDNSGYMSIDSENGSLGIAVEGLASFHNEGVIECASYEPDGTIAVQATTAGRLTSFSNSGRIAADVAVAMEGSGSLAFVNTGEIHGAIDLGDQSDRLVNSGALFSTIALGDGNDLYQGLRGRLDGVVYGQGGDDRITGGLDNDRLHGDGADDAAVSGGADSLAGGKGQDELFGGGGADRLLGGSGGDTLMGGEGADVFSFASVRESHGDKADLITDLESADLIELSAIDADIRTDGDQAFTLVASFDGHAGQLVLSYDAGADQTLMEGDVDGDGQADLLVRVAGDQTGFSNFTL